MKKKTQNPKSSYIRLTQCITQMQAKHGPYYDKWKAGMERYYARLKNKEK